MRPTGNSTVSHGGLLQWNSPLPYLFGGLAIVFGIIGIALLFLACSPRRSRPEFLNAKEEKNNETNRASASIEPKVVVIMAGDDQPRFVAKPCP
ncbi:glutamine dumper 4 [Hibiscus trionum]|uniref:Glutamine dumper 4 n=1 Tax=Hibiscus trionum TaxID=183268 RepID=A0A9W7GZZ1_HIBTR|nr:glutamine dumper 4 [Hibiscus trionum]